MSAKILARNLLLKRYAACISFKEIESIYWWEGQLEQSAEVQILIKTSKDKFDKLCLELKNSHSYSNPELLFWNISASSEYKNWINEVLKY